MLAATILPDSTSQSNARQIPTLAGAADIGLAAQITYWVEASERRERYGEPVTALLFRNEAFRLKQQHDVLDGQDREMSPRDGHRR